MIWTYQDNDTAVLDAVIEAYRKQLGNHEAGLEIIELFRSLDG